jgi:hypothetical protein
MAGFNAGSVVEPLDYDFRPFVDAHGTITEPTDAKIAAYLDGIKAIIKKAEGLIPEGVDENDPGALVKALDNLEASAVVGVMGEMAELYSKLCSGKPTKAQILNLPMRIRQVFFAWLQSEVMSPEVVTGAGNGAVTQLPRAVAG